MIYTMNGMTTWLNLRADSPGTFGGLCAFQRRRVCGHALRCARRVVRAIFAWAQDASHADKSLDEHSYGEIAKPSMKSQPAIYHLADPQLFHAIVTQELPPSPGAQAGVKGAALPAGVADAG